MGKIIHEAQNSSTSCIVDHGLHIARVRQHIAYQAVEEKYTDIEVIAHSKITATMQITMRMRMRRDRIG